MNREQQLKNLFDDNQKIRFGCVMFDLQENEVGKMVPMPGNGWASIEGKDAYRIKSSGDLSNDVKWLTNLPQDIFWKSGLVKQSKLKPSNYLRTEIGQIMKELGLLPPQMPIVNICKVLSTIFSKIMRLAIEFYDLNGFNQKDLATEIRQKLFPEDRSISIHVDEALLRAYQDLVICEKPITKEKVSYITLKRPRYFHSKTILETSVPALTNKWEFFAEADMPSSTEDKLDFLMKKERPFIAKVTILSFIDPSNMNVDLSKLLNLGEAIGEGGKKKERNWVCQPEILYLSKFANLEISAAFVAEGYTQLEKIEKKIELPNLGELSDFSYSLGLLAENVWMGLAARSINPQTRSKSLVSPRACWMKAADRFMTLTSAMMLSSAGFVINTYGYGGVTVIVENTRIPQLIEIAPHAGLCVPMNILEKYKVS
jgi:hypothetical protein